MEIDDKEIINSLRDPLKKEKVFSLILDEYQERIYWHIRRMLHNHEDSNDVAQETWVKFWGALSTFRGDSKVYSYIYRIATNEVLAFLRKKKRQNFMSLVWSQESYEDQLKADEYFDGDEAIIKFKAAIATLPPKQQLVFNMKYYDDMRYNEIAEVLKTSVGSLKASYHIAVKKIEKKLRGN